MFSQSFPPAHRPDSSKLRPKKQRKLWAAVEHLEIRVLLAGNPLKNPVTTPQYMFSAPLEIPLATNDRPAGNTLYLEPLVQGNKNDDIIFEGNTGLTVILNNGDGTFAPPVIYPTHSPGGLEYESLVLADVNGDGMLDAVLAFSPASAKGPNGTPGNVDVLIGNSNGTFKPEQVYYNTGPNSIGVAVADFDITGKPHEEDIAVTNLYNRSVTLIAGNGDGTFVNSALTSNGATALGSNFESLKVGNEPDSIVAFDVNGDGKPDLVVGNVADDTLSVLINNSNGSGTASFLPQFVTQYGGDVELVKYNGNTFLGTIDGLFSATTAKGGQKPTFIKYAEADGDGDYVQVFGDSQTITSSARGKLSVVVPDYTYSTVSIDVGYAGLTFGKEKTYSTLAVYSNVTANATGNTPAVVSNTMVGYGPVGGAAADLNGDGYPDLVVADYGFNGNSGSAGGLSRAPAITIFFGDQAGTFPGAKTVATGEGVDQTGYPVNKTVVGHNDYPNSLLVTDVNGDNLDDIITANYGTPPSGKPLKQSNYPGTVDVLINNGNGENTKQVLTAGNGPDAVAVADLAGDGVPDLLVLNRYDGTLSVFKGISANGSGLSGNYSGLYSNLYSGYVFPSVATNTYAVGNHPESIAIADFNGDGKPDVVVVNYGTPYASAKNPGTPGSVMVMLNNGYGALSVGQTISDPYGPVGVTVGDFGNVDANGDQVEDIAITNHLLVTEGKASTLTTPPGTGYSNGSYNVQLFLGNGDGTFQPGANTSGGYGASTYTAREYSVGAGPTQVIAAHLDGPSKPLDLAVLNQTDESLTILAGNGDGSFFTQQVYDFPFNVPSGTPAKPNEKDASPVNIAIGDVNGDGVQDIIVDYSGTDSNLGTKVGVMVPKVNPNGATYFQAPVPINFITHESTFEELPAKNPIVYKAVQDVPIAVAVGDINGDGKPDIVTFNSNTAKYDGFLSIFYGTSTNTTATAPKIDSANDSTFTVGSKDYFTITTAGYPDPTITEVGSLPTGLSFVNNGDGTATISGTPAATSTGTYTVVLTATNGVGTAATQTMTIVVNPAVTSAFHATFTANSPGSFTFTTTGLSGTVTSELEDLTTLALPAGLTFTPNDTGGGTLAGTPAANTAGYYEMEFFASDATASVEQEFNLDIDPAGSVSIASANSTIFTIGAAGTFSVITSGFSTTPTITKSGTLPSGITLVDNHNGTATLSGTPVAGSQGTYPLTITATAGSSTATQSFVLTIAESESPVISSANNTSFVVGTAGTFSVTTSGFTGTPAITKSGSLPSGVTLVDNGNGTATLAGTPASGTQGTYPFTITATGGGATAHQNFTLTVTASGAKSVTLTGGSETFTVGTAGTATFTATGFSGTPTFSLSSGTLPSGLTLTDNGNGTATIAGTPATGTQNTYSLTITATGGGTSASLPFTLTVNAAGTTSVALTGGSETFTVGTAGTATFTATGFSGTPTFSLSSGTLPSGLTLTDNGNGTATIAGTPAAGTQNSYSLTITATGGGSSASLPFTLTVNPASGGGGSGTSPATITSTDGFVTGTGTNGNDTASLAISNGNLVVTIDSVVANFPLSGVNGISINLLGGDDSITVAAGVPAVSINGGGGNDTIVASNGAADTLSGGNGNDSISAGSGNQLLEGGAGNDTLLAGIGNQTLLGNGGADSITGGPGNDLLRGNNGNDTIMAGTGLNTLNGGAGNDSLVGGVGMAYIIGGSGVDTLAGGPNDTIVAESGDSVIHLG